MYWIEPQPIPPAYRDATVRDTLRQGLRGRRWSMLTIYGPPGVGKTWEIWALVRRSWQLAGYDQPMLSDPIAVHRWRQAQPVIVLSEIDDLEMDRYHWSMIDALRQWPGVLCLDDIGYRQPSEWVCQAVYAITNHRVTNELRTIVTCNRHPSHLAEWYGEHVASRIRSGDVIEFRGVDRRCTRKQHGDS